MKQFTLEDAPSPQEVPLKVALKAGSDNEIHLTIGGSILGTIYPEGSINIYPSCYRDIMAGRKCFPFALLHCGGPDGKASVTEANPKSKVRPADSGEDL